MVRKSTPSKTKRKRSVKKRRARRHSGVLSGTGALARLWRRATSRLPKTVAVPGLDHDVATSHALAFLVVLGLAIGAGYVGAKAVFGPDESAPVARMSAPPLDPFSSSGPRVVGVILPEPNGHGAHAGRAYEEKVQEEIYVAPDHPAPPAPVAPEVAPEVASLPEPGQPLPLTAPLWMRNALQVPAPHPGPVVAIVIDDMGVDKKRSRHMWEDVPGPLTLSFMGYADDLAHQTQAAHAAGHELMLHMSMEPSNATVDPGPNVLMTTMADEELVKIADWGMARFDGFVGVNNHMGSRFTEDPRAMRVVLERIRDKGLLFLDSRTSPKSVGRKVAREVGLPVLERNVFLDNENDIDAVRRQLDQLESLARRHGFAIAIGHPRDATIEVLKTWVPEAKARGLNIVPVSALLLSRMVQAKAGQPG